MRSGHCDRFIPSDKMRERNIGFYRVYKKRSKGRLLDVPQIQKEVTIMYSLIIGYAENNDVEFCPYCGAEIDTKGALGDSRCRECGRSFYVIDEDDETFD